MNEPETTTDAAVPYFRDIFEYVSSLDVQKRARTFALAKGYSILFKEEMEELVS